MGEVDQGRAVVHRDEADERLEDRGRELHHQFVEIAQHRLLVNLRAAALHGGEKAAHRGADFTMSVHIAVAHAEDGPPAQGEDDIPQHAELIHRVDLSGVEVQPRPIPLYAEFAHLLQAHGVGRVWVR